MGTFLTNTFSKSKMKTLEKCPCTLFSCLFYWIWEGICRKGRGLQYLLLVKVKNKDRAIRVFLLSLLITKNINRLNPIQFNYAFHRETSHLICIANQMASSYIKCNTVLNWVILLILSLISFTISSFYGKQVMFCAICYRLYNFKNVKNTHGRVLLLL